MLREFMKRSKSHFHTALQATSAVLNFRLELEDIIKHCHRGTELTNSVAAWQ